MSFCSVSSSKYRTDGSFYIAIVFTVPSSIATIICRFDLTISTYLSINAVPMITSVANVGANQNETGTTSPCISTNRQIAPCTVDVDLPDDLRKVLIYLICNVQLGSKGSDPMRLGPVPVSKTSILGCVVRSFLKFEKRMSTL